MRQIGCMTEWLSDSSATALIEKAIRGSKENIQYFPAASPMIEVEMKELEKSARVLG